MLTIPVFRCSQYRPGISLFSIPSGLPLFSIPSRYFAVLDAIPVFRCSRYHPGISLFSISRRYFVLDTTLFILSQLFAIIITVQTAVAFKMRWRSNRFDFSIQRTFDCLLHSCMSVYPSFSLSLFLSLSFSLSLSLIPSLTPSI